MHANKPNATYYCPKMNRWYLTEKAAISAYKRQQKALAKVGTLDQSLLGIERT